MFCPIAELQETICRAILDCEDMQLMLHSGEPATATAAVRGEDAATGLVVSRLKCLYGVCEM